MAPAFAPSAPLYLGGAVGSRFIGQWNWGAALLFPLWLMTHRRVPLGIIWLVIGFIPVVSIASLGALVYFGMNGNTIAVNSGRFSDEATFVAVQNAWKNWGLGLLLALVLLSLFSVVAIAALGFLGQKAH